MEEINMKNLIKAGLCLALACGFVACEKPMEHKKKEEKSQRSNVKKSMLSQQVDLQSQEEVQQ
jgi:hypothetical protein